MRLGVRACDLPAWVSVARAPPRSSPGQSHRDPELQTPAQGQSGPQPLPRSPAQVTAQILTPPNSIRVTGSALPGPRRCSFESTPLGSLTPGQGSAQSVPYSPRAPGLSQLSYGHQLFPCAAWCLHGCQTLPRPPPTCSGPGVPLCPAHPRPPPPAWLSASVGHPALPSSPSPLCSPGPPTPVAQGEVPRWLCG